MVARGGIPEDLAGMALCLRDLSTTGSSGAALEKDKGADAGAVINAVFLDIEKARRHIFSK